VLSGKDPMPPVWKIEPLEVLYSVGILAIATLFLNGFAFSRINSAQLLRKMPKLALKPDQRTGCFFLTTPLSFNETWNLNRV
jgi:hypothetical protein